MKIFNQKGQVLLLVFVFLVFVLFFLMGLLSYTSSQIVLHRNEILKVQAFNIAEAGMEIAIWKLNNESGYNGELGTDFGIGFFDIEIASIGSNAKETIITSYIPTKENPTVKRITSMQVGISSDIVSFNYGVHVGEGGLEIGNGSRVEGNVFSNGNVFGGTGTITEDLIVAGNGHSVDDITVNGDALSYSCLSPAKIKGNLTYITGGTRTCAVTGTISTQSEEIPEQSLPISQDQINSWKTEATQGGVINGDYTITNSQIVNLGPTKINGKLTISNSATLNITGTIYVTGDIVFDNNSIVRLDSSYGFLGGVVISDGKIEGKNNSSLSGSGESSSYLLLLSTSTLDNAIVVDNNSGGAIFYASVGGVELKNNIHAKEVTGYKVKLDNNAVVEYETGLANIGFTSGPGGSWSFVPGTYLISQ